MDFRGNNLRDQGAALLGEVLLVNTSLIKNGES